MATNYTEQLQDEIAHVPKEYLPALLNIVHSFRESVDLKTHQDKIYDSKLAVLRAALIEGEQSGDSVPFNMDEIISETKQESILTR